MPWQVRKRGTSHGENPLLVNRYPLKQPTLQLQQAKRDCSERAASVEMARQRCRRPRRSDCCTHSAVTTPRTPAGGATPPDYVLALVWSLSSRRCFIKQLAALLDHS